jgi:hypothetical protein
MRILITVVGLLVALPAFAADVTWTWNNPTSNTNGSAIPASGAGSLNGGRLEFGTCGTGGSFGTKAGEIPLTQALVTARTVTQTNVLPSTVCGRVFVTNTFGNTSAASNVFSVTVAAPTPAPPMGLSAVEVVAYEMRPQSDGTFRAVRLGLIQPGTVCSAEYVTAAGQRYHRIDLRNADLINWPANTRALPTAWAVCA